MAKNQPENQKRAASEASEKSDAALREEAVLQFWNAERIFEKTLEKAAPNGEFVFYDGPPFATGTPHHGHILASTIKDTIPRYKTMRGYHVPRKWGWDCHGLPLENIIEKQLGLTTKRDIEALGVEQFNEAARSAVMEYADDWKEIIPRMGRWADMEDDYKTMDATYTESVWWVFKALDEKGLVYEGFKSMHLCPRCGTTLSNFEVNLGYKDIKDIAVTVKLPFVDEPDTSLLVWTTTPWTLPGNMAAAVHKDHVYVKVAVTKGDGTKENVVLAKERLSMIEDEYDVLKEFKGEALIGRGYRPPFNYFTDQEFENKQNAWKVYHAEYVELGDEGTGAVHLAPAYGEEDMELAKTHHVPIVHHVDSDGRFKEFVTDFAGQLVKPKDDTGAGVSHLDADVAVVRALATKDALFKKENITHSYPHCWRCDTPLLNYATTSWFVRVTDIKDDLVTQNNGIHWVPEHVGRARFGDWLLNARDWAVSRQRYWGAPLPVWRNPQTKEYRTMGSLAGLQQYVKRSGNTYYVARHGESELNAKGVLNADPSVANGLTEKGRTESETLAEQLQHENITHIYYSPLERTKATAELVAEKLGLPHEQVIADERIYEMRFGPYEGKAPDAYHAFFGDGKGHLMKAPEGGESWMDVKRRAGEFLFDLETKHTDARVLVVTHNGTAQMLQAAAAGDNVETTARSIETDAYDLKNGEYRALDFTPFPHNRDYELDFHRPYIDEIELYDESGTKLERVPDVFDCWFESGSMPYAQQHYPFEHTDRFEPRAGKGYPADFIAESIDQTRGWFYSLIVLGTALFGQSPYRNVITNGLVLAEDGRKMSKSLKNYPDPMLVADRYGADTMRFYLLSSPIIKGEDLNFSEKSVAELSRKNIGRLHNVLSFYELYRDDTIAPNDGSAHVLDVWMRARLAQVIDEVTAGFESYELDKATRPLTDLIDDLSVWYLRRSRDRFKSDDATDKAMALGTLRYVLRTIAQVMAPSMPFYAEHLYRAVRTTEDPESVHLTEWPAMAPPDTVVLDEMNVVREFVTIALEARTKEGIKVRQPLPALYIKTELASEYAAIVADEVNVKEVIYDESLEARARLDTILTEELKREGVARELMRAIQDMRKKAGLAPSDRITLTIATADQAVIAVHKDEIMRTTGADALVVADTDGEQIEIEGVTYTIHLQ